jgi:hypothetical protein
MLWHPPPANDVNMVLSVPVAFQYPEAAALFGLAPFGYLRSLGLKKYHSFSPNAALADDIRARAHTHIYIYVSIIMITSTATWYLIKLNEFV